MIKTHQKMFTECADVKGQRDQKQTAVRIEDIVSGEEEDAGGGPSMD